MSPLTPSTILLVDDSEVDRATYRRFLQTPILGSICQPGAYHLVEATTGEEALAYCQQGLPDLILLDYVLPDMSGLDLLQELQQITAREHLPVIMMTGQSSTAVAVATLKGGAMDYLDKSQITMEILHRTVSAVRQQTQLVQALHQQQQREQLVTRTALQIRQSSTLEEILQTTVDEVRGILNCDRVMIYQFLPDWGGQIAVEAVSDPTFSILGQVAADECFPQEWIEPYCQGRTRAIDNIYTSNLSQCHIDFLANLQVKANAVAPILCSNQLWGLLLAHECQSTRCWQPDDIELLAQLATQVSIAIQQSLLVQQLQTELQERQAIQNRLQSSEELFRAVFEAEPECVKVISPEGILQTINAAGLEMLEADSLDQVLGHCIYPFVDAAYRDAIVALAQQVGAGKSGQLEFEITGLQGTRRWLESHAVPLSLPGEPVAQVLCVTRDITDRKRMEIALLESEEKLRLLIRYAPASIAMFDREICYISASQRWIDDYQLNSLESIVGRSHYEIFPEIPAHWKRIHQRCLAGLTEKCDEELFVRTDGSQQWLRWECRPWYHSAGTIGGITLFTEDITQRKQAESALQESEMRFHALTDAIFEGIVVQEQGRILEVNPGFATMFGYSVEEVIGTTVADFLAPESVPIALNYIANQHELPYEITGVRRDGTRIELEVVGKQSQYQGRTVRISAVRNISERKQAALELKKFQFLVEHASDMVVLFNPNRQFQYANQLFCQTVGYTREELGCMQACAIYVDGSPEEFETIWLAAQQGQLILEQPHRTKSGQIFDAEVSITYLTFEEQEYLCIFGRDITDRKRMQTLLQESETRLRLAQSASQSAVWDWNIVTNTLFWSPEYYQLYQLDPAIQPTLENWTRCIDPEDVESVTQQLQELIEGGSTNIRIEFRVSLSDGTHWFCAIGQVFHNESNQSTRMLGITIDITQQKQSELALQQLNQDLEQRVAERTRDLLKSNERLQQELFQRERAERALAASEARFRSAFEDAAIGMALVAPNGQFLRGNAALSQIVGYSQAELKALTFQAITHPDDLQADLSYVQQMLVQEIQTYQIEKRYIHKDGHAVWILLSVSLVRNEQDEPLYFISQIQDISERVRLEADRQCSEVALRQSESTLRSFFNHSGLMMGIVELREQDVLHLSDNATTATFFGRTPESMKHQFATDMGASPETVQRWITHYREAERTQAPVRFEYCQVTPAGECWLSVNVCQILQGGTPYPRFSYVAEDVTARKQAEAVLNEYNRRWRSLLDNVQLLVVGLDHDGNVDYVNPFFLEVSDFTLDAVIGKPWIETFIPGYQRTTMTDCFQEVLEHNFHPHYQNPILTKSGTERMIAWSNTLLHDPQGQASGTISIGEDITERYQLERMKAEFISVVSHELRTPLTSMQAALSLLVENILDPNSPEGQEVIQIAAVGVDRLVRLVNDILDLERLESGKIRLEQQPCNLADVMTLAVEQMQEMANQAGVTLNSTPQSCQVVADSDRLLQVLINLLSNAIKFSAPNGIVVLSAEIESDVITVTVQDQGRGIPADKLERIFERFQQVDASDSREKGGTGLGLAICRSIVQQHGGQIWAESTLDQGSTFYFTLPLETNHYDR